MQNNQCMLCLAPLVKVKTHQDLFSPEGASPKTLSPGPLSAGWPADNGAVFQTVAPSGLRVYLGARRSRRRGFGELEHVSASE